MDLEELDTPALWADLEIVENNLKRMAGYCSAHALKLRPHVKTHKTVELAARQLELGACGITCAKVTEAEVMAACGCEELLLAYPLWGAAKWRRLAGLAGRVRLLTVTDSVEHARALAEGLSPETRRDLSLLVEVDIGLGRCGLQIDGTLAEKLTRIAASGIPVAGVMFYQGRFGLPPEKSLGVINSRLGVALEAFEEAGLECRVVSGGSTPTAFYSHRINGLSEIRPGTYIFNDCNTVFLGAAAWEDCALRVRCRVVSTAVPGRAIIDGGSKTFSDAPPLEAGAGFGRLIQYPEIFCEKMNEEHGYLKLKEAAGSPQPGELVDIIPNHACTAVNMHHTLYGVRDGVVECAWRIAAQGKIH